MEKAKEISALWEQIKPQIDEMVHLCYEVESHYEVTADAYQRGYEAGLNDAWEAARWLSKTNAGVNFKVFVVHFTNEIVQKISASECIEKIRVYEQEKEKFHVGDEFEIESGKRFVILKMDGAEINRYIDEDGKTYCLGVKYKVMRKTGRHFPEIAEVLRKMREDSDG